VAVGLALDPVLLLGSAAVPRSACAGPRWPRCSPLARVPSVGLALLRRRGLVRFGAEPGGARAVTRWGCHRGHGGAVPVVYVVIGRTASVLGTPALARWGSGSASRAGST
jgi:hypothetical protein